MKENILQIKSFAFAREAVKVYKHLMILKEYDLARQVLKSGTSIGANIEEAIGGFTQKEFAAKLSIAYKESRECSFWLRLLESEEYLSKEKVVILLKDLDEIQRIIAKTISTIKSKNGF
jgi:four helix bundle protein